MNKKEEAEKKKREKAEADAKKKADKAAAAEAKKAAGAAARAPRVQKTVLGQFKENVEKAQKFMNRAGASFKAWSTLEGVLAAAGGGSPEQDIRTMNLTSAMISASEISPRLLDMKEAILALEKCGFVPGTAPRGPKFAVGEIVRIDDEWMPKYTKSGFYKAEELSALTIVAIGEKEVLTKTASGREVTVRAMAHLEATSLEDATAPATEPDSEGAAA